MYSDLISVIVPAYDVEKYVIKCVNSILRQTYKNIELILVDDGSKDRVPDIFDDFAKKDKRIVVIHKKNGGLSDARNAGLKIAKGKYVTFVDSDDKIEPNYVMQLYETLVKNEADISICGYTVFYDNGRTICHSSNKKMVLNPKNTLEKMLYQEDFDVASCGKLYKSILFDDVCFPKGENYEDSSTTYKLVLKSKIIACNMISQYDYQIRENSILTSEFSEKKMKLVDSYDKMSRDILRVYPELKDASIRAKTYARISTLRQMMKCKPRLIEAEKKLRKEILADKMKLLKNKRVCNRDKIAVICLNFGLPVFKLSWRLYCKITGRNM